MQIAKQARNERGQKLFEIFRQRENDVCIASLARLDTQLKRIGGAGQALYKKVLVGMVVSKRDM